VAYVCGAIFYFGIQTLATHQVPFFDGTQWVDSGLQYRVQWSLAATLPSNMLQEVEDALASDLHHRSGTLAAGAPSSVEKQAGGAAAAMSAADVAREGVRVSVSKVDTVLANVAASQFPGQTVLFVVAPRKAKVGFIPVAYYTVRSAVYCSCGAQLSSVTHSREAHKCSRMPFRSTSIFFGNFLTLCVCG